MNILWDSDSHEWVKSPSIGLAGGLLCSWDKIVYKKKVVGVQENLIWCIITSLEDNKDFCIFNIYSPQELWKKKLLWREIKNLLEKMKDMPC